MTVRISGFFRDAFPHLVDLLDDAVTLVAGLDEPVEHELRPQARAAPTSERARRATGARATARDLRRRARAPTAPASCSSSTSRNWRDDADLAEVYEAWGGHAYGRGLDGVAARDAMRRQFARIDVAVKNHDNREHDIFDSTTTSPSTAG